MRFGKGRYGWILPALGAVASVVGVGALACSDSDAGLAMGTSAGAPPPSIATESDNSGDYAPTGTAINGDGTGTQSAAEVPALPAEVEVDPEFELPHAGERYVYAVNPDSDSVAVIDATTLAIHTVDAGDNPKFLQTLAGTDSAIVLNVNSQDATVIRTEAGASTAGFVDVAADTNAIAVAPDGKHAVVYYDADYSAGESAVNTSQSVSVLTLEQGNDRSTEMSVGFRPSAVHFAEDGSRAFVVTEDGVSILDFAEVEAEGSTTALPVPVSGGLDKKALDVSITLDGQHALAREQEGGTLRLVNLETGAAEELDLAPLVASSLAQGADGGGGSGGDSSDSGSSSGGSGGSTPASPVALVVGDVDLSPSGEFAIAVVRSHSLVLKIPVPAGFSDPSQVEAVPVDAGVIGSVTLSADSRYALLYTTVIETDEWLTILDLETTEPETVDLRKSVQGVAMAPDGSTALVVHQKLPGDPIAAGGDEELALDRSYGYSVVKLGSGFAKLQVTESEVMAFTLVPDASALFLLLQQPWEAQRVRLDSFVVESLTLASKPVAVGTVPESQKVFVGQEHPDGRITFIDWESLETTSVTGFELNSKIQER